MYLLTVGTSCAFLHSKADVWVYGPDIPKALPKLVSANSGLFLHVAFMLSILLEYWHIVEPAAPVILEANSCSLCMTGGRPSVLGAPEKVYPGCVLQGASCPAAIHDVRASASFKDLA